MWPQSQHMFINAFIIAVITIPCCDQQGIKGDIGDPGLPGSTGLRGDSGDRVSEDTVTAIFLIYHIIFYIIVHY